MKRVLVATAVEAERAAILAGLPPAGPGDGGGDDDVIAVDVIAAGVGCAAAAAGTAARLATAAALGSAYDLVVSAGIGGGFAGRAAIGDIVVGTAGIAADLGARTGEGFLPLSALGFGTERIDVDPGIVALLVEAIHPRAAAPRMTEPPRRVRTGAILSVNTVTGTGERARELAGRHPEAVAEAMEGYGVACAAAALRIPFAEIRTVSNVVGPRDRAAWRIPQALASLSYAAAGLGTLVG